MAHFTVTLSAQGPRSIVVDCDAYAQEGTMTTFFAFGHDRDTIDSWSQRVASYRTRDIASVERGDEAVNERSQAPATAPVLHLAC
jgi:hypothetical protein